MGGTEVLPALREAFRTPLTGTGWYKQIIFLTDGEVGNADEVVGLVASNVKQACVYTLGIGMGASTYLVEGVARVGRGVNELRAATMKILNAALQPRAQNVQVKWDITARRDDGTQHPVEIIPVPEEIPPIFNGRFTTVYGLFKPVDGATLTGHVTLECDVMSEKQTLQIDMSEVMKQQHLSTDSAAGPQAVPDLPLHRLAGKCQLNELGDKHKALIMREKGEEADVPGADEPSTRQGDADEDTQAKEKKQDDEDAAVTEIRTRMERLSC
ncbi:unnamed protein product, partial [Echinostoma caproni]|uniref:VWFA domain-containing protein n=1 Tax=Echinostoma caproni TaxID=27848 RepID=A0A183B8S2_9TREM